MKIKEEQSRNQDKRCGNSEIGVPVDEPLREFADALRQATLEFPEHERLAVCHAVAAAKQLTCALLGSDAAASYVTLLQALNDLDHGQLPHLFRPNYKPVGFSPDGPSIWAILRATAAACVTAVHQTTGNLTDAAELVKLWSWEEASPYHLDSWEILHWRRDLQRRAPKLSAKQRELYPEGCALTDLERAKPVYQEIVMRLSQVLADEGPEVLRDTARRMLLDEINTKK